MEDPAKLVAVVADKAYESVLNEVFARSRAGGFRPVQFKIVYDDTDNTEGTGMFFDPRPPW